jgi:hypothetical protein
VLALAPAFGLATNAAGATSPLEATAWHLTVDRDRLALAGVGRWDRPGAEWMLFLQPAGMCRIDLYDAGTVTETTTPPSPCAARECVPCTWTGDPKGKRVTLAVPLASASGLLEAALVEQAAAQGVDTAGMVLQVTKNACAGVAAKGRLTVTWNVAGKVTLPALSPKSRAASWQMRASGKPAIAPPPAVRTGRFVDPPTGGLGYRTASQSGVTADDGSFQYRTGETISFFVGATTLGATVPAAERMTPLDLVPGATLPVKRVELERLRRESGQLVPNPSLLPSFELVNILVLLHSLDADKDSSNGIGIRAGIPALFAGTALDLRRSMVPFSRDAELRRRLWRAFEQGQVDSARLIGPSHALDRILALRGLVPQAYFTTYAAFDGADANPDPDSIYRTEVDSRGFAVSESGDTDGDGDLDFVERVEYNDFGDRLADTYYRGDVLARQTLRTVDIHGRLLEIWTDSNGDGGFDRLERLDYDADGNLVSRTNDTDGDGTPNFSSFCTWDAGGRRTSCAADTDGNGIPDQINSSIYDDRGRLIRVENDGNADGVPESTTWYENDDTGNPLLIREDWSGDGQTDRVLRLTWDGFGNLIRREFDIQNDGFFEQVSAYEYDDERRNLHSWSDYDGDGVSEEQVRTTFVVDPDGNLLMMDQDYGDDGSLNHRTAFSWSVDGRLLLTTWDTNGDGLTDAEQPSVQDQATLLGLSSWD